MIAPELFTPEAGQYLGLYSVARQLEAARTDDGTARSRRQPVGARRHHRGRQHHRCRQGVARGAGGAQAGAGTRRQRRGDQEAHRESARGAGQFPAPARRAVAQQSAATGASARSQHQGAAPAGSQQHDRPHGAAVALRRQGCRQAIARAVAADAGKPADGAARPVRRRRDGAGAERARRHDPQAAAVARQDLQAGPGFAARPHARQAGRPKAWATCSRTSRACATG